MSSTATLELSTARPYAYKFKLESTALLMIDMQRDFLDKGGYGDLQCGDPEALRTVREIVPRARQVLDAARSLGLQVMHTREGHMPDLSDLPPSKRLRQLAAPSGQHTLCIGDKGPMGCLLIRGEHGHDIIDELKPFPGEVVIDKPGKGSFWNTTLHRQLLARGITHILIAGVTTECCVNATFREASDRGFECCVLTDCTSGFKTPFVDQTLEMMCSFDGLFGYVSPSIELLTYAAKAPLSPPTTPPSFNGDLSIPALRAQYSRRETSPTEVAKDVISKVAEYQKKDPAVWTFLKSPDEILQAAQALESRYNGQPLPPLYGLPFGVKDTIDVAGIPTTAACEAYTYTPDRNARVLDAILNAGALLVGKTNLDQLATGLSGCRSPFGAPRSVYDSERISGGSSSGSAVAVGAKLVSFTVGTDTAGSGRAPAAFNGITGFKPTKGTLSAQGLVPACKTLDTITVLASSVEEARAVWLVAEEGPDPSDPCAKSQQSLPLWHVDFRGPKAGGFVFGVPPPSALEVCTPLFQQQFAKAAERMQRTGGRKVEVDWAPFNGGNQLLYEGALLNERIACLGADFLASNLDRFEPPIRDLFKAAMERDTKPWDVFRDQHLQGQFTRQAAQIFEEIDVLLVPTVPCHPTVAAMMADPLKLNARLGEFTHFANVLDLCGIALNASFYEEGGKRLPFGVTVLGASGTDGKVFDIAREFESAKFLLSSMCSAVLPLWADGQRTSFKLAAFRGHRLSHPHDPSRLDVPHTSEGACRRRKTKCVTDDGETVCVLCRFYAQACTYEQAATQRKRSIVTEQTGQGRRKVIRTAPGTGVEEYDDLPGATLLKRTLGLQNLHHSRYIGSNDVLDPYSMASGEATNSGKDQVKVRFVSSTHAFQIIPDASTLAYHQEATFIEEVEASVQGSGAELVRLYFRIVQPAFPILHKDVFLEKYARSYQEFSPPLLAAVYLLASSYWSYSETLSAIPKPDLIKLRDTALASFQSMVRRPKLSTVQAGLLLSQYTATTQDSISGYSNPSLTAQLVELAFGLGLHLDAGEWDIPLWEISLRRRLSWSVFMQDKWTTLLAGRPSRISSDFWGVNHLHLDDIPRDAEDEAAGSAEVQRGRLVFVNMAGLTVILSDVLSGLFSGAAQRSLEATEDKSTALLDRLKPLQIRLKDWFTTLPDSLKMDTLASMKLSSVSYLKLAYLTIEAAIHRQLITQLSLLPDTSHVPIAVCRAAARERLVNAIDFVQRLQALHLAAFWYDTSAQCCTLVYHFGRLLSRTAVNQTEKAFYDGKLKELIWSLKVNGDAGAGMMRHALNMIDLSSRIALTSSGGQSATTSPIADITSVVQPSPWSPTTDLHMLSNFDFSFGVEGLSSTDPNAEAWADDTLGNLHGWETGLDPV
ncbi:hypothetical protein LTR53_014602 [Teratosphaeriaceae sp. CCFEE 6253]|nr:hypothetical protein LTR53_014602 [Teratosphaeriaceae sp. CCFEE 6253]